MTPIEQDILTWCRWHWSEMRWHRGRCESAESKWRSPQVWDAPPVVPLGRIDVLRAMEVEGAWRGLESCAKLLLKWHFVFLLSRGSILRRLRQHGVGIVAGEFQGRLDGAVAALDAALRPELGIIDRILDVVVRETAVIA